jgi:hypothetical protein
MTEEPLEPQTEVIAETENFMAWQAEEPDGEIAYHLELDNVTLHFFQEEWDDLLESLSASLAEKPDKEEHYLEYDNVSVQFSNEDWNELMELARLLVGD